MEMKKRTYVSPGVEVTRVELESSICDGSVEYKGDNAEGINIASQDVIESSGNDFSGNAWGKLDND